MLHGYILIFYSRFTTHFSERVSKIKKQYLSTLELAKFLNSDCYKCNNGKLLSKNVSDYKFFATIVTEEKVPHGIIKKEALFITSS